jgi:hypothetical protein
MTHLAFIVFPFQLVKGTMFVMEFVQQLLKHVLTLTILIKFSLCWDLKVILQISKYLVLFQYSLIN